MMKKLPANFIGLIYGSGRFDWDKQNATFYAEASDLGVGFLSRLFNDSHDYGFAMQSAKTDDIVIFILEQQNTDDERETISWTFVPIDECTYDNQLLLGVRVKVFND
jgi:hypothetical protein